MGLLDFVTDPFGVRYKKRSMNERLGITAAKRKLTKKFVQPFNKLNPMWHLRNAKRNVKRKLGYNSEFAKAYRSGEWGKYMKRKLLASDDACVVMPFRESQFTHYDMQSNPFDREQTGPTNKGMFRKLSKYVAPGIVAGLALHASKRFNLLKKITDKMRALRAVKQATGEAPKISPSALEKMRRSGVKLWKTVKKQGRVGLTAAKKYTGGKVRAAVKYIKSFPGEAKGAAKITAGSLLNDAKNFGEAKIKSMRKAVKQATRLSVNPRGKIRSRGGKRPSDRIRDMQSLSMRIMPFRESYGVGFNPSHDPSKRQRSSLAQKVITAGIVGAAGVAAFKLGKTLSNQKTLTVRAEKAYQNMRGLMRKRRGYTSGLAPVMDARIAMAQMKHEVYGNAASAMGMFRSQKVLDDANRAAKMVRFRRTVKSLKKSMPKPWGREGMKMVRKMVMKGHTYGTTRKRLRNMYYSKYHKPTVGSDVSTKIISTVRTARHGWPREAPKKTPTQHSLPGM